MWPRWCPSLVVWWQHKTIPFHEHITILIDTSLNYWFRSYAASWTHLRKSSGRFGCYRLNRNSNLKSKSLVVESLGVVITEPALHDLRGSSRTKIERSKAGRESPARCFTPWHFGSPSVIVRLYDLHNTAFYSGSLWISVQFIYELTGNSIAHFIVISMDQAVLREKKKRITGKETFLAPPMLSPLSRASSGDFYVVWPSKVAANTRTI